MDRIEATGTGEKTMGHLYILGGLLSFHVRLTYDIPCEFQIFQSPLPHRVS